MDFHIFKEVINWSLVVAVPAVGGFVAWVFKNHEKVHERITKLSKEVAHKNQEHDTEYKILMREITDHQLESSKTYATKVEVNQGFERVNQGFERVMNKLESMDDKLDKKADKERR